MPRTRSGPRSCSPLAGGLPLRWSAWPIYLAALARAIRVRLRGDSLIGGLAHRVAPRTMLGFARATSTRRRSRSHRSGSRSRFATRRRIQRSSCSCSRSSALLRYFSRERQRRIDHALELSDAYRGTAFLLGDVVEADDAYTGSHSRHVVDLVLAVADELKLSRAERRDAEFVALLHDVGKIRIPAEIINKPGPLDADERAMIETHTIEGEEMLERVGGLLGHVGRLVRSCHEHWDGSGYPDRLAGEEIPLVARIVCACDAFSAMTTDRPYRAARTETEALAEMAALRGHAVRPARRRRARARRNALALRLNQPPRARRQRLARRARARPRRGPPASGTSARLGVSCSTSPSPSRSA